MHRFRTDNRSQRLRDSEASSDETEVAMSKELGWKERMKHFTWTWYTLSMATGGIANVLHAVPFRFSGLNTLGLIFYFFNLLMYLLISLGLVVRAYHFPTAFRASFLHPTESLFIPASMIALGTVLVTTAEYGLAPSGVAATGPWLLDTLVVVFWIYAAGAVAFTVGIYVLVWSTQTFTVQTMTPLWIFPAYPLLLVGPFAAVLTTAPAGADGTRGLQMIVGGVVVQGMGFLLSLTMHATYIYRLMTQKLPGVASRPGMFISVGPSGFTVTALIGLAGNIERVVTMDFMGNGRMAGFVARVMGYWAGIWLWGLALIFFFIAVTAHWSFYRLKMPFAMTWNSFIFPNTALLTATFAVAKCLDAQPIAIVACVLTCLLILLWFFIVGMGIRAVVQKQILWPQKQEDRDDEAGAGSTKPQDLNEDRMDAAENPRIEDRDLERGYRGTAIPRSRAPQSP